jgi:hypothetical protein
MANISNYSNLQSKLAHIRETFEGNGYSPGQAHRALQPKGWLREIDSKQKPISTEFLPHIPKYIQNIGVIQH